MEEFNSTEIRQYYRERAPQIKTTNDGEWRIPCLVHKGKDPNFAIDPLTGRAICHSHCGRGWDMLSLEMELFGVDFATAKRRIYKIVGRPEPRWDERDVECTYDYRDEGGALIYQVVRKSGKRFSQRRPNPEGGWIWGLGNLEPLLFRLQQIKDAQFVAIAEGEKDVLNLERIGIPATCNSGGAGKFSPELARWFANKRVAVFPDNDDVGRKHAMKVATLLKPVAETVRIVEIPGLPHKGDISDFIAKGGGIDELRALYGKAADWSPDFEFASAPNENDKYVQTFAEVIESCGGADRFWDFRSQGGISTPFKPLTKAISGGMRPGEVYVIGANQGAGKTSLALQFVIEAIRDRKGVLMFSMEMGLKEVYQRMCSIEARVDLNELREFQLGESSNSIYRELRHRLQVALSELVELPLLVSRKSAVTPEYIVEESHRLMKRQPISLIVVDHLQLMAATGSVRSDYEKFTNISRAMKQTAIELNVPLLLVSQTSRSNAERKTLELEPSDLRGSGAIEEDAAAVMLLYDDKEDRKAHMSAGTYSRGPVKTWLKLAKNRFGEQGSHLSLMHYKTFTRFELNAGNT